MITFSDIYEAMRKEKYSEELQRLPAQFLVEASNYFREKKAFLKKEDDVFSEIALKNKKKLENALSSFRDLLRNRKKKILNLAFVASEAGIGKKDFENLLEFEKKLFEGIVQSLKGAEENLNGDMNGSGKDVLKHKLVRFIQNVPEFLGLEGDEVGPFEKGEVANLEKEIVEILEKGNQVEVIETE